MTPCKLAGFGVGGWVGRSVWGGGVNCPVLGKGWGVEILWSGSGGKKHSPSAVESGWSFPAPGLCSECM